jgi:hypothetical protein
MRYRHERVIYAREGNIGVTTHGYGTVNMSPDWASDIDLTPDEAEQLAKELRAAAKRAREESS